MKKGCKHLENENKDILSNSPKIDEEICETKPEPEEQIEEQVEQQIEQPIIETIEENEKQERERRIAAERRRSARRHLNK